MEKSEFKNKEIKEFFRTEVANLSEKTQISKMYAITTFMDIIGDIKVKEIEREHILRYIENKGFQELANSSKNLKIVHIGTFLKYYGRDDLVDIFPKYNEKEKELNKNDLISREDLEKILKSAQNITYKTLVIVLYESAVRKAELVGVKRKHIQFYDSYCNLYIDTSKTTKRNIPLVESIPYLREYFNAKNLEQDQKVFPYVKGSISKIITRIEKATKKKYPEFKKHLNPHLFRHSRLTELASNRKLNEPQLRKFAGWSKNSNMPAIYFHLDDSSIRNEIIAQATDKKPKKPKIIGFETLRCPNCSEMNNKFNEFCWKCGKVINEGMVIQKIKEQEELEKIREEHKRIIAENKEMRKRLEDMSIKMKEWIEPMKNIIENHKYQ